MYLLSNNFAEFVNIVKENLVVCHDEINSVSAMRLRFSAIIDLNI